jgi:Ca2+-binding EF-hand superfamily protein
MKGKAMNKIYILLLGICLCVNFAWTQEEDEQGQEPQDRQALRAKILQKFDADGDGQLSPEERQKAKQAFKHRRQNRREGDFDMDQRTGDQGDRKQMVRRMLKKFDADGDGQLSPEERQKAKEAFKHQRQNRRARDFDDDGKCENCEKRLNKKLKDRFDGEDDQFSPEERGKFKKTRKHMDQRTDDQDNRKQMMRRMLKKFDADGDGQLSPEERQKAREAFKQRRQNRHASDGDDSGKHEGDGKLTPEEREKVKEFLKKWRAKRQQRHEEENIGPQETE